jgi:hypothetical protein
MLKVHRERARKEVQELLMGTRSSDTYDMQFLAWEMFEVKDDKLRILDVDADGMRQIVKEARKGCTVFESSSSQTTILQDITTPAQKELWQWFGKYFVVTI